MYLHPSSVAESTGSTPLSDTLSLQITHPLLAHAVPFASSPATTSPVVPLAPVLATHGKVTPSLENFRASVQDTATAKTPTRSLIILQL